MIYWANIVIFEVNTDNSGNYCDIWGKKKEKKKKVGFGASTDVFLARQWFIGKILRYFGQIQWYLWQI